MRIILFTLVFVFTAALAHAAVVDGRPGRLEIREAIIDADIGRCAAWYEVSHLGNSVISNSGAWDTDSVQVTANKNMIKAKCKFTDSSGTYESNAEVGFTDNCELIFDEVSYFGSGRVTAAANNENGTGGNVTLQCTFDLKQPK